MLVKVSNVLIFIYVIFLLLKIPNECIMLELHLIAIKDDLGKMIGLAFREMLSLAQKLTTVYFFKS